jgi:hypothetical protein
MLERLVGTVITGNVLIFQLDNVKLVEDVFWQYQRHDTI